MVFRKSDLVRSEIIGATELLSDGYGPDSVYLFGITVVSTDFSTSTVVLNFGSDEGLLYTPDHHGKPGDIVWITGTSGNLGDGYYTLATIVNDFTLIVNEVISSSTGGQAQFSYPAGASNVGVDTRNLKNASGNTLQSALTGIDQSIVNPLDHQTLRQLIHFLDEGPGDGFDSGAYKETLNHPFPNSIIWYTDNTKSKIIVSKTIMRNSIQIPITITWQVYKVDGINVAHTVTDTITYINNVFESSRTRNIT